MTSSSAFEDITKHTSASLAAGGTETNKIETSHAVAQNNYDDTR